MLGYLIICSIYCKYPGIILFVTVFKLYYHGSMTLDKEAMLPYGLGSNVTNLQR